MGYTKEYLEWLEHCRDTGKDVDGLARKLNVDINSFGLLREMAKDRLIETVERFRGRPPKWDVFLSHASENKNAVARPLYEQLYKLGLKVWFDDSEYRSDEGWPGILYRFIHEGVACSRVGVVVVSPEYVHDGKIWTTDEYSGLRQKGYSTLFFILHGANPEVVGALDPELAAWIRDGDARVASTATTSIEKIAQLIVDFIKAVSTSGGFADPGKGNEKGKPDEPT